MYTEFNILARELAKTKFLAVKKTSKSIGYGFNTISGLKKEALSLNSVPANKDNIAALYPKLVEN